MGCLENEFQTYLKQMIISASSIAQWTCETLKLRQQHNHHAIHRLVPRPRLKKREGLLWQVTWVTWTIAIKAVGTSCPFVAEPKVNSFGCGYTGRKITCNFQLTTISRCTCITRYHGTCVE